MDAGTRELLNPRLLTGLVLLSLAALLAMLFWFAFWEENDTPDNGVD